MKKVLALGKFRVVLASLLVLSAIFVFLFMSNRVQAANKFWIASGPANFNDNSNWSLTSGGPANTTAPGANDNATFDGNGLGNCTITADVTVGGMTIGSAYTGTITVATGINFTLAPFSSFVMDGGTFNTSNGTFLMNAGEFAGTFDQNGGVFNGNGTLDFNVGNMRLDGGTFNATSGTTTFHRTLFRTGGTFNHNNGTVIFMASAGGGLNGSTTFNNLTLNNSADFSLTGTFPVMGTLSLNSGGISSGTIEAQGSITVDTVFTGGTGTLSITGSGTRTITFAAGTMLPNLIVNAPNAVVETSGSGTLTSRSLTVQAGTLNQGPLNLTVNGNYNQNGGTFNGSAATLSINANTTGACSVSGGAFNGSGPIDFDCGTFTISGGAFKASAGNTTFHRAFFQTSGVFNHNSGTVIFVSTPGGGINVTASPQFHNLTLSNTGDNFSTTGTISVAGILKLVSGLVNSGTIQAQGDVVVENTFGFGAPANGGTVNLTFNGIGTQTYTNNGGPNPTGTWTINKSSGMLNLNNDLDLSIGTNALTLTAGTIVTGTHLVNAGTRTVSRSSGFINGNLRRSFTATGTKVFDVGSATGYSPVSANVTTLTQNPSSLTIGAVQGAHPNLDPSVSLGRYWSTSETGALTASLSFTYLDPSDINGNETDYRVAKIDSNVTFFTNAQIPINRPANTFAVNAVTDFTTWTLGTPQVLITPANTPLAVFATQTFAGSGGTAPYTFTVVAPNNSGATINSSTGLYTAGALANVQDTVRVTDAEGRFANAIVSVVRGPPHHLRFTQQPSNTVQNLMITPPVLVTVVDQGDNPITGATNPITLSIGNNPANGSLAGTLNRNAVAGVATFNDLSINNFGDGYTLAANATGLVAGTSNAFNILGFLVVNTNDSGPGSLRQAITNANNTPGTQTVTFNISGTPPFTISPLTTLPTLTQPIIIDGTSQPLFSGTPIVEIRGQSVGAGNGLKLAGGNSLVRGLIITGWNEGIHLTSSGNTIRGNYLGVGANGSTDIGNLTGVRVDAGNNLIGGNTAGDRNVISGNNDDGISIISGSANVIRGNYIGTDASGLNALKNTNRGIYVQLPGQGTIIGGTQPGEGNIVAFNGFRGIEIWSADRVSIRGNSIHSNLSLGIEVYPQGINSNDAGDVDTGSNGRQNYPTLGFVTAEASQTLFQATLNSTPNSTFTLDFYSNPLCDPSVGYGEGKTYLGSASISTDSTNIGTVNVSLPVVVPIGHFVTATATDVNGNTSEFSQCRLAAAVPVSISGRIVNTSNAAISNVSVKLDGPVTRTTVTNSTGDYSFGGVIPGADYTVTPLHVNHSFAPTTRSYSTLITDQTNQNFTGTKTKATIVGTLLQMSGNTIVPVFGGVVRISNSFGTMNQTSVANPVYVFQGLPIGEYTITPEKSGVVFSPSSLVVQLLGPADQNINFTGQALAPLPGRFIFDYFGQPATMTADGSARVRLLNEPAQTNGSGPFQGSADFSPNGKLLVGRNSSDLLTVSNADGSNHRRLNTGSTLSNQNSFAISPDGTRLVCITGDLLKVINVDGTGLATIPLPSSPSLTTKDSPTWISNSRFAFAGRIGNGNTEIFAINANATGFVQLTNNFHSSYAPVASPNGSKIAFVRDNDLRVMNSDGTGDTLISAEGLFFYGYTWSPDGTKIALTRHHGTSTSSYDFVSINSSNGGGLRIILSGTLQIDQPSWGPAYEFTTPTGANVTLNTGFTSITFGGVTTAGTTTITPIPPLNQGPGSLQLFGTSMAFEISTTASFTPPINICLTVPSTVANSQALFDAIFLGHSENGIFVDITTSRNFATRTICGSANSLSPFGLGVNINNNLPSINGLVLDNNGNPIPDVFVELTGTEERTIQTDAFGNFNFVNLTQGGNYNIKPQLPGYLFEVPSQDFVGVTGENVIVFTGTPATFTISGKALDGNGNAIAGVSLELSGGLRGQTFTAADGTYSFSGLPASGEFSISAVKADVVFNLDFTTIGPLTADQTNVDFIGVVTAPTPTTIQLTAANLSVGEGAEHLDVIVQRGGDSSGVSTVSFATSDLAGSQPCDAVNSLASARCDYETTLGTIGFAPGETSKSVRILVVDDVYLEGLETLTLGLANPVGASLGSITSTTVTIVDNDLANGINPLGEAGFYVRQHYLDFFTREPDSGGLAFWTNEITSCGNDQQCIEVKRINVSAAFYLSIEFQETGYLIERLYKTAYGDATGTSTLGGSHSLSVPMVRFNEFLADTQQIGAGVVVGQPGWEQVIENNKQAFISEFVQRFRFTSAHPALLTAGQFVDQLNANAGNPLSQQERDQLVNELTVGAKTRAQVLRVVAEDSDLASAEFNRAFVLMQYFGYLRRDPNDLPDSDYTGYDFWLTKLNQFGGNFVNAEMVKAFILSGEYRHRFGP